MGITLPHMMQTHIYCQLGGQYNPDFTGAQQNLWADDEKLLNYLGTYFPRSFTEYYYITNSLLSNLVIKNKWKERKDIRILDIGSGTGGNLLGLLHALRRCSNLEDIEVISLDGNGEALKLQQKVIVGCYDKEIDFNPQVIKFSNLSEFASLLQESVLDKGKFDFIICSKFLSEMYLNEEFKLTLPYWNGVGYYTELFSFAENALMPHGIMIVSDVTVKVQHLGLFVPNIINDELKSYLQAQKENGLRCILPQSCAHWIETCSNPRQCFNQKTLYVSHTMRENDRCKFTFRVLSHKDYAQTIVNSYAMNQEGYVIAEDGLQNARGLCVSGRSFSVDEYPGTEWQDAFSYERMK